MHDEVLGSLVKDHESMRAMRRVLAAEAGRARRRRDQDQRRLRAIVAYAGHDPRSYHHLFEGYLMQRLVERWPGAEPVAQSIQHGQARVDALAARLRSLAARSDHHGLLWRLRFELVVRRYVRRHEALLQAEENRLFPLFRDMLVPADWVEATTAFEWSLAPDTPRHLIAPSRDHGGTVDVPPDRRERETGNDSVA